MGRVVKPKFLFKWNSVKTKLITSMIIVALVPTISISVISTVVSQKAMTNQVSQSTLESTKQAQQSLDYYLQGIESQLDLVAHNINFTEFYKNPFNAKYGSVLLNGTLKTNKDYANVYFASTKKDMVLAPKTQLPADYDPTSRDWYKGAVEQNGKVFISKPYKDVGTHQMVLTLSQAVLNHNQQLVGVAAIDIGLSQFSKAINHLNIGENGYMSIVSQDGSYITHPDQNKVGSKSITKLSIWDAMQNKNSDYKEYTMNGVDTFSAFSTDKLTGWKFISTLDYAEINKSSKQLQLLSWILVCSFALLSALSAFIIGKRMAKNIITFKEALQTASNGDFTTRVSVHSQDEFKELEQSFNGMMEQLSEALLKVDQTSKAVRETSSNLDSMTQEANTALHEVAISINEIAKGAYSQATNVHTSAEQMKELSQQLDGISTVTEEMNTVSHRSLSLSNNGLEKVRILTEKASETKSSTSEVSFVVKNVAERMEEINEIIEVITKITEQTNLLSLNASIESARAGEHGRGFAVVANEVRSLAEQSKASATEIKRIVNSIKGVVKTAVKAMEKTSEVVQHQDIAVKETEAIFNDILLAINDLAKEVVTVESTVKDSQSNKDKVREEMDHITAVSQETAAATEEVSAAAEEISATMQVYTQQSNGLKELSEQLEQEIQKFKLK
jgi:methyl-accepting chemotaxis protein